MEHKGECCGVWEYKKEDKVIVCSECGASYPFSKPRMIRATSENIVGYLAIQQGIIGKKFLNKKKDLGN